MHRLYTENYRSVGRPTHDVTDKSKTPVEKDLTYIITSIKAFPIRLTVILAMSVSTFTTADILNIY